MIGAVGILGSGFGLYGYLPAVAAKGARHIVTLSRYAPILQRRPELQRYVDSVTFVDDRFECITRCDLLIIALRPCDQYDLVIKELLQLRANRPARILLEKPIATTPASAKSLLAVLAQAQIDYRISYTFSYTVWGLQLLRLWEQPAGEATRVAITWRFLAHHHRHNLMTWKRAAASGGGPLRFYGIQAIGLLCSSPMWNSGELPTACASVTAEEKCFFAVASRTEAQFIFECDSRWIGDTEFRVVVTRAGRDIYRFESSDPFEVPHGGGLRSAAPREANEDRRVPMLMSVLSSFSEASHRFHVSAMRSLDLWQMIEEASPP